MRLMFQAMVTRFHSPCALCRPAHAHLAPAHHLLDDAEHRLDRLLAKFVQCPAALRGQTVNHVGHRNRRLRPARVGRNRSINGS